MAVTPPTRRPPPKRPTPARVAKLDALADLHTDWVESAADGAGFHPDGRKTGSDYNVHHVTLDADPEALGRFHTAAAKLFTQPAVAAAAGDEADQQRSWQAAVAALLAGWPMLSVPLVNALSAQTAGADAAALALLVVPQNVLGGLAAAVERAMGDVAVDAAVAEAETAQAAGVTVDPPTPDADRLAGVAKVTAALIAVAYVAAATRRALQVGPAAAADAVRETLTTMGAATSGAVVDHIRVAMSAAQNAGRMAVFGAHQPYGFRASEHLDPNACEPCRAVHGKTYETLDAALVDYPGNAGYKACTGGLRCRGHINAIWTTGEAP